MRRKFDKEFKRNAVHLVSEKKISIRRASKDLGLGLSTLQRWIGKMKTAGESSVPGKGHL